MGSQHRRSPKDDPGLVSVGDFEEAARNVLPRSVHEFIVGGAADEITLRWNREAYDRLPLRPRVLVDVSRIDTGLSLFGTPLPHPILLAPAAYQKLVHPLGEVATARGAAACGAVFVLSSNATVAVEEVGREGGAPLWFQLYVQPDPGANRDLIGRAQAAGCRVLCVTVDTPVLGPRNREQRARFVLPRSLPLPMNPHNLKARREMSAGSPDAGRRVSVTWKDVERFKSQSSLPVVLKGILHEEDAEQAVRIGVDGLIVSNHGARNLDTAPAALDALPRIADRVGGRIPVLVDGGIRRGTDVLKALSLGAAAVMVGRPYLYGLAVSGARGVARVVGILHAELEMAMALSGRPRLSSLDRTVLGEPVLAPGGSRRSY